MDGAGVFRCCSLTAQKSFYFFARVNMLELARRSFCQSGNVRGEWDQSSIQSAKPEFCYLVDNQTNTRMGPSGTRGILESVRPRNISGHVKLSL